MFYINYSIHLINNPRREDICISIFCMKKQKNRKVRDMLKSQLIVICETRDKQQQKTNPVDQGLFSLHSMVLSYLPMNCLISTFIISSDIVLEHVYL